MDTTPHERYQLAGLDARERGFSRPVDVMQEGTRYRASLRYETTGIVTEPTESQTAALQLLIHILQGQGYRLLKTQLSFQHGMYLGSREAWVEYPDPSPVPQRGVRLFAAIRNWFHRDTLSA